MINLDLVEQLKKLPQEQPFPGVHLITIQERPLIKTMALLTDVWIPLTQAMAGIKDVSKSPESSRCGTTMLFDLDHLPPTGSAWLLIDAMANRGKLTYVKAVVGISDEGSEELCRDFGLEVMEQFKAATSAMKDMTVLCKEDFG